jgi:hypothetical protein
MVSIQELLSRLRAQRAEFVIIGGMAGVLHGSAVVTDDLDLCAPMTQKNLGRILAALAGLNPRHRMSPKKPELGSDPASLREFKNLYLITAAGQLDILGEVDGIGKYATVRDHAVTIDLYGSPYRVLDLESLMRAKTKMGRPKDLRVIADLEVIRQKLRESGQS